MDDFWGDSNGRSHDDRGARPEWPGDGSVTVYYSMSAEIEVERQALAARWHRLRCAHLTVLDPDWLNGVQEEIRHELAAADRSPIEADAGPSPNLILDDPV
jgi:hypothetical protein